MSSRDRGPRTSSGILNPGVEPRTFWSRVTHPMCVATEWGQLDFTVLHVHTFEFFYFTTVWRETSHILDIYKHPFIKVAKQLLDPPEYYYDHFLSCKTELWLLLLKFLVHCSTGTVKGNKYFSRCHQAGAINPQISRASLPRKQVKKESVESTIPTPILLQWTM